MPNITVRTDGIINNTLTEEKFLEITSQLFGEDKTLEEYINLYNDSFIAKRDNIVVHKEVEGEVAQHVKETVEIKDPTIQDYLDAAESNLSDAAGYPVTIEFADDE